MEKKAEKPRFRLLVNERTDVPHVSVFELGWEACKPNHKYGPVKRAYYLIHYICKGKGTYTVEGKEYKLSAGQAFLIQPGVEHFYKADKDEPWEYYWFGFHGSETKELLTLLKFDGYVINAQETDPINDFLSGISAQLGRRKMTELATLSYFYRFLDLLAPKGFRFESNQSETDRLCDSLIRYVQTHIGERISVQRIADGLNVNRSHLYRVFKERMGTSIKDYIQNEKLYKATLLLKDGSLTDKEIAQSLGFDEYVTFLKAFKKKFGVNPSSYRAEPFETSHN